MDAQEREVIDGIFHRLREAENQPRDPEAERYIADLVARQPYATYALAQSVYVQDMAVQQLSGRNQELEQRVSQLEAEVRAAREEANAARQQAQQAPQPQAAPQPALAGGFLSGLFGGGRSSVPPTGPGRAPQGGAFAQQAQPGAGDAGGAPGRSGPWARGTMQGGPNQPGHNPGMAAGPWGGQQAQAPAGGGFMRTALTTAAGVAGGALLFDAVKGMMGGSSAANATPTDKADAAKEDTAAKDDATADAGKENASAQPAADQGQDASYQDASYEQGGWGDDQGWGDAGGWDDGGGDDSWL